jgi:hypothetical protein
MTCRLTQFIRLPRPIPDQCSLFRKRKKSVICGKLAICVGVLLVGALQAFAQTRINVNITATSVPKPLPNQTCKNYDPDQGGFDSVCPSGETQLGSNCECINIQDARVSGNLWGSAQLLITEDLGSPTVTPEQNCVPFYGVIYITSAANTDSASATKLDVVGVDCDPLATSAAESFRGSFGPNLPMSLTKESHPSISMTDYGTLKGTVNANGVLRMKLKSPRTSEIGEDTTSSTGAKDPDVPAAATPAAAVSTPVTRSATASTPVPRTHVTRPTATPVTSVPTPSVAVPTIPGIPTQVVPATAGSTPVIPNPVIPTPTAPAPVTPAPVASDPTFPPR